MEICGQMKCGCGGITFLNLINPQGLVAAVICLSCNGYIPTKELEETKDEVPNL